MLGTLSHGLQKFFGFVGASLTGITAIFTAMGFLAERARLSMLGLPGTAFDLQQYLETGARMFAFLPIYLGTAFLLAVSNLLGLGLDGLVASPGSAPVGTVPRPLPAPNAPLTGTVAETLRVETSRGLDGGGSGRLLAVLVLTGALAGLWYYRRRTQAPDAPRLRARAVGAWHRLKGWGARHRPLLLLLVLLAQFAGACQQARTIRVRDVLFETSPVPAAPPARSLLFASTETLEHWVRTSRYDASVQYLGWLFLLTLLTAWVLYTFVGRFDRSTARPWERCWMVGSMLLLVSQVTLLPVNYGVLLSSNQFPSVCVAYGAPPSASLPPSERMGLVHETDYGYYLYAPARRRMWFVQRGGVEGVRYYGMADVLAPARFTPSCEQR